MNALLPPLGSIARDDAVAVMVDDNDAAEKQNSGDEVLFYSVIAQGR